MTTYYNTPLYMLNYPYFINITSAYRLKLKVAPREYRTADGSTYQRDDHFFTIFQLSEDAPATLGTFQYLVNFIEHTGLIYQLILNFNEQYELVEEPMLMIKYKANGLNIHQSSEVPPELLESAFFNSKSIIEKLEKKIQTKIQLLESPFYTLVKETNPLPMDCPIDYYDLLDHMKCQEISRLLPSILPLVNDEGYRMIALLLAYEQASFNDHIETRLMTETAAHQSINSKEWMPAYLHLKQALNSLQSSFNTLSQDSTPFFTSCLTSMLEETAKLFLELKHLNDSHGPLSLIRPIREFYCTVFTIRNFPKRLTVDPEIIDCLQDLEASIIEYCEALNECSPKGFVYKKTMAIENLKDIASLQIIEKFINHVELNLKNYDAMRETLGAYLKDLTTLYVKTSNLLTILQKVDAMAIPRRIRQEIAAMPMSRRTAQVNKPELIGARQLCHAINTLAEKYNHIISIDPAFHALLEFTTKTEYELNYPPAISAISRFFSHAPLPPGIQGLQDIEYSPEDLSSQPDP